ncbi:MAG: hypothetical protein PSN44_09440 [Gammaproteobacteria bacterium]|nr:hypothetical protein [Gammaproteobacteria bacterium]
MSYLIDALFVVREIILLSFMVITSPMGIIGGLLLLDGSSL